MTLKELQIFYELSSLTSPSLVEKKLNFSQGTVSLALKSLEEDLGVKLFDRIGKKLVLNEYGRVIKEKIGEDKLIIVSSDKNLNKEYFIDELFDKKWILREIGSGTREMFLNAIRGIDLPVFYETNSISEIKLLLKKS